jgi:hypothetical protein
MQFKNNSKMKKYKKPIILVIVIVSAFFIVKSRRVSQSTFDLMVTINQVEVLEVCNNRLSAKQKNSNINFKNVSYNDELYYNYIISKYGDEICNDPNNLKKVVVDYYKEYFRKQWKFIL